MKCGVVFSAVLATTVITLWVPSVALAQAAGPGAVPWENLELNDQQRSNIHRLEGKWKNAYQDIHPQIVSDQQRLKMLLNAPDSDENEIRLIQHRLRENEQRLTDEATQCFLGKKRTLSDDQLRKLQHMMNHRRN